MLDKLQSWKKCFHFFDGKTLIHPSDFLTFNVNFPDHCKVSLIRSSANTFFMLNGRSVPTPHPWIHESFLVEDYCCMHFHLPAWMPGQDMLFNIWYIWYCKWAIQEKPQTWGGGWLKVEDMKFSRLLMKRAWENSRGVNLKR